MSPSDSLATRSIDSERKLDMRDTHKVQTQVEYCCGRRETAAELTAIAVAGSYVVSWDTARQSAEQKG